MSQKKGDDSGKSKFFEIKDEAVAAKLLDIVTRHRIDVTLWLKAQSLRFETRFDLYLQRLRKLYVNLPEEVSLEDFREALKKQGTSDAFGSFQVDAVNFFFKTSYLATNEKGQVLLAVPRPIYKMQRRANLRIPFKHSDAPKLTMFDPAVSQSGDDAVDPEHILSYRMLDVSAGGIAFAAKLDEKERFAKGTYVREIRFKLRGKELVTEGSVVHAVAIAGGQGNKLLKVGIKFNRLRPEYEKVIAQFVLDESRLLFSNLY